MKVCFFYLSVCFLLIPCWSLDDSFIDVDNSMKFGQKVDDEEVLKEANTYNVKDDQNIKEEVEAKTEEPPKEVNVEAGETLNEVKAEAEETSKEVKAEAEETPKEVKTEAEETPKEVKAEGTPKKPTRKKFNINDYRLLSKTIPDGRPYAVYDGLLRAKDQVLIKKYLTYNVDAWLFNNYDKDDENKQKTHDNTPWINEKDPSQFSKSRLCKRLIAAVLDVSKANEMYYPYRVFGKILRRGDHTLVSSDSNDTGDYTALVFVNEFWRKNYYGELYLYDNDKEIVGGATHRPGRVVIYDSTVFRLNRPPAVAFLQGQVLFQVQFSKSEAKMTEGHNKWLSYIQARTEAKKSWHLPDYKLPNGDPFVSPDPEKHKVFEYTTKTDGRKIFVYDNLFPEDLLNHLRAFVLKYGSYFYDDSIDKHSDNVQWIAGFLLKPYIQSPYWEIVKNVAKHATGSDKMFPYDVSINLVRSSDHTRIHGDVGYYGEEEFTCLVYLNPNWKKNYYGETTFFEKNSDDTEIVAQVRPRYGRTVIFDGNIPHSARPPSFNFSGARLTFVTKLHKNEYTGRKKNFQEDYRHLVGTVQTLDEMAIFGSRKGEKYARQIIQQLQKMREQITYRPDKGDDGEGEEDAGGEEKEEGNGNEGASEDQPGGGYGHGPPPKDGEEQPLFEEEPEDQYSKQLVETLDGVSEKSEDGVEKFIHAHDQLDEMQALLTKQLSESMIEVM